MLELIEIAQLVTGLATLIVASVMSKELRKLIRKILDDYENKKIGV